MLHRAVQLGGEWKISSGQVERVQEISKQQRKWAQGIIIFYIWAPGAIYRFDTYPCTDCLASICCWLGWGASNARQRCLIRKRHKWEATKQNYYGIWCKADRSSVRKMTFFQSFFIVADTCRRAVDCVFNFVECDTTEVRDCRKGGGVVGVRQSGKRLD